MTIRARTEGSAAVPMTRSYSRSPGLLALLLRLVRIERFRDITSSCLRPDQIQDMSQGLVDVRHTGAVELRQRPLDEPCVVDRSQLIDQEVRAPAQRALWLDADAQGFRILGQRGGERDDQRGRVAGVEQR